MITVSAPGKIHLMGEHAVVYGKPALLTAIDRRIRVSVEEHEDASILIEHPQQDVKDFILYAIEMVKKEYSLSSFPGVKIHLENEFPFGYHLGSSAALAVATVGAVVYQTKKLWNPNEINRIAYEVEKKQHGNPSGGDNTVSTFGGFLWFRKELEFLKSVWQLPFRIHPNVNHFFLVNTGKPYETTGEMVAMVKTHREKNEEEFEKILTENEKQTRVLAKALKEGIEQDTLESIKRGERTLEQMGVVSEEVASLIQEIDQNGGVAKILGGGGKRGPVGFILCYHTNPDALQPILARHSLSVEHIQLGEEGVKLEKKM